MARVVWPRRVTRSLLELANYIRLSDPAAATRIAHDLQRAGDSLADFPNRGRPAPRGARELVTVPPYVIRYRVTDDVVTIIHIRHGARRPLD